MKRFVVSATQSNSNKLEELISKRKAVKAANGVVTDAKRAVDYANALMELGVDEHDILIHFFDYLPSSKVIEILKDLAIECDCEEEVDEIVNGSN